MSKYGFSFSWKRALGISAAKQRFARQTGIPTTQSGLERIAQLSVALNLNRKEANNVWGSAGNGNVPKSHTNEPVAPRFAS